jgi:pyruvate, water dikinase
MKNSKPFVLDLSEVSADDVALVGGKCSSLGELFRELTTQGVRTVDGFTTTSHAYEVLLETGGLRKRPRRTGTGRRGSPQFNARNAFPERG